LGDSFTIIGDAALGGVLMSELVRTANAIQENPPAVFFDPVIEAYKKDIDRTLLRGNLKLTVEERFRKHASFMRFFYALREAGEKSRERSTCERLVS
jgi:hypothetical protein